MEDDWPMITHKQYCLNASLIAKANRVFLFSSENLVIILVEVTLRKWNWELTHTNIDSLVFTILVHNNSSLPFGTISLIGQFWGKEIYLCVLFFLDIWLEPMKEYRYYSTVSLHSAWNYILKFYICVHIYIHNIPLIPGSRFSSIFSSNRH